jgi:U3 small nucleolar RNA-associated protein 6
LQKFPSTAELWILAAQYEYETNFNITGARNLFLRSLRLNPEKRELWLEYAKLECFYILKILERRKILGLDKAQEQVSEDLNAFQDQDEITLPTITEEELQKTDGPQLDPLLTSPLTDISKNPALNGAIPLAVYSSAITTRPDDICLVARFYDMFASLHPRVPFINLALDKVKEHLEETFPGRGQTLLVQIKDHARGLDPTSKGFPAAIREMIKAANRISSLSIPERKECCKGLLRYLEGVSLIEGLDENLQKAIKLFEGRLRRWQDITDT